MLFIGGKFKMATKKQTDKVTKEKVQKAAKAVAEVVEEKVEKIADVVENKAEKVMDIVEDKVADTVKEAKEVVKKAKKATTKKDIKTTLFVEYFGKQVEEKEMIAAVKKAWTSAGNKVGDIKTIELYVKPEDGAVYYVINKTESGKIEF